MKIVNTLDDFSDLFLRRLVTWCCKGLDLPVRYVKEAAFRRSKVAYGGASYGRKIGVRLGPAERFPVRGSTHRPGNVNPPYADRIEALVHVTAHELAHSAQIRAQSRARTTGAGKWGGSEAATDALVEPIFHAFQRDRERLLAEWSAPAGKVIAAGTGRPTAVELREAKARKMLASWERRARAATAKVRLYRLRVRGYERRAQRRGEHEAGSGQES